MKIACIGGAGYYFLRPISDICMSPDLAGCTIAIYDLDHDRSALMAKTGRRLSKLAGAQLKFQVAKDLKTAVAGADFVITSIGGAGASGSAGYYNSPVHLGDKLISAKHGIPQVVGDTAGPAAMMAAFRSIPIHLNLCKAIEKYARDAILLNHANPMAILCMAMAQHANLRCSIGICHGVQGGIIHAAKILDIDPNELECVWIGTNHYYWFTHIRYHGKDMLPELWNRVNRMKHAPGNKMCEELSQVYGHWIVYPADDHVIEFYPYLAQAKSMSELPYALAENHFVENMTPLLAGKETLTDIVSRDRAVPRRKMLKEYAANLSKARLPETPENSITGEGTASLIADIALGRRNLHICNIPNRGAVSNLPEDALLEVEAVTDSAGVRSLHAGKAPPVLEAILRKRTSWHKLVVEAAVKRDKGLALQAMQIDECAIPPDRSEKLLDELIKHNRIYSPGFWRK